MSARLSETQKAHLVAIYEASGQTQATFCQAHDLAPSTFYNWCRQYGSGRDAPSHSFIELTPVPPPTPPPAITLTYANGVTLAVETADFALLQHLIQCGSDV